MAEKAAVSKLRDGDIARAFLAKHPRARPEALARHYLCACGHAQAITKIIAAHPEREESATHNKVFREIYKHYSALLEMHQHDLGIPLKWPTK